MVSDDGSGAENTGRSATGGGPPGSAALLYLAVLATIGLLVLARDLFIPFAVALMLWVLIRSLADAAGALRIGGRPLPGWARMLAAASVIGAAGWGMIALVTRNIEHVTNLLPGYQVNLEQRLAEWGPRLGLDAFESLGDLVGDVRVMDLVGQMAQALGSFAGTVGLVLVYLLFLLVEQRFFPAKLEALCANAQDTRAWTEALGRVRQQIQTYVGIKTAASALTGIASYAVLRYLGVDLAGFWALLIFALNFIPTMGSIVAVVFPLLLVLVQFEQPGRPFLVAAIGLITIQVVVGNVLEPRWMGDSLNLSPLAVILTLTAWGAMWGVVGMFLSVPLTVIVAILCNQWPRTRGIAILLAARPQPRTDSGTLPGARSPR
jgi:AI-2 transport protein TqsA